MKKKIITGLMVLASMIGSTSFAQDIYKTAANVPMVQLNNGILMPQFGLGTFLQPSDAVCEQLCLTALKAGYRHIDTAHAYNDEAGVGRAVKESGIPREEIWITSKLWPTEYGEGKTLKAIDEMLERMQLEYIDLLYVTSLWATSWVHGKIWRKPWRWAKCVRWASATSMQATKCSTKL